MRLALVLARVAGSSEVVAWGTGSPRREFLHVDDLALYHLPSHEYETELEIPSFFKDHNFTLGPELELEIETGGSQLIDIAPLDSALQALSRQPTLTASPVVRAWPAADMALCLSMVVGHSSVNIDHVSLFD